MSIALLLGICIGAILGLTGAGGGMLAVPALVTAMGWSMQQAAPVALIAVSLSATLGAWDGYRKRLLRWRGALLMAASGAPMTWLGAKLAAHLSQPMLQGLFAIAMSAAAVRMLQQSVPWRQAEAEAQIGRIATVCEVTGRFQWNWPTAFLLMAIGALTGTLTGLLGVGGGFVMVPLLRRFSNVSMHGIVATSLSVIALVGLAGVVSSVARGIHLPLIPTAAFAAACMVGMLLGRRLAQHLSSSAVQRGFAVLLLLIAARIAWQVMPSLLPN
ncbi:MAG: sulfite exporter TauE/SafE family protein [Burkholderiales bacterium]|nr:sulfite exporter TauE/SafE family protein [Burkholderiales bacterium]